MKNWTRSHTATYCGYCGKTIAPGAPICELSDAKKKRCSDCAGSPVPADLPLLTLRAAFVKPAPKPKRGRSTVATLAADYKLKQAGDRS